MGRPDHLLPTPVARRLPRYLRRAKYALVYLRAFSIAALHAPHGIRSRDGRRLLWGKLRRFAICCVPGLAERLQQRYGLRGGCTGCGASCNLILRCPHWNPANGLCTVYADRPATCRMFPITPADLDDLRLASSQSPCGYTFGARTARADRDPASTRDP